MTTNLSVQNKRILFRATMALLKQTDWTMELMREVDGSVAEVRLERVGHFYVYLQSWMPQADEEKVASQVAQLPQPALLIADYINPKMGERLRTRGLFYLDSVGNAYLKKTDIYINIQGNRELKKAESSPLGSMKKVFTPAGMQLLFCLLEEPSRVSLAYRQLASLAGVAVGTIGAVFADLKQAGYLIERKNDTTVGSQSLSSKVPNQRILDNLSELAKLWSENYVSILRNRKRIGRYLVKDWGRVQTLGIQQLACWGVLNADQVISKGADETDIEFTAAHKKPVSTANRERRATFYLRRDLVNGLSLKQLSEELNIVTSPDGDLDIVEAFWSTDHAPEVHPLIIYGDRLSQGISQETPLMKALWQEVVVQLGGP